MPVDDAAVLCAQLPQDSRVFRVLDPDSVMTYKVQAVRSMEHSLRVLVWQNTKDGIKGRNEPEPMPLPSEIASDSSTDDEAVAMRSMVDRVLGMSKEGVD